MMAYWGIKIDGKLVNNVMNNAPLIFNTESHAVMYCGSGLVKSGFCEVVRVRVTKIEEIEDASDLSVGTAELEADA